MVKLLVERGAARLDAKDFYGKTPRAWSEEKGFTDIQNYLIAKEKEQDLVAITTIVVLEHDVD